MGFVPDALVQFLPEPNGMTFTLCDNVPKYSELLQQTREKGGVLLNINLLQHRPQAFLGISGTVLQKIGLSFGDTLLIRYEFGFVRMRKIPMDIKIVTSRLFGKWLAGLGFVPGSVLTVDSSPGLITCQLHENGQARTHELVNYARKNKLNLIQVTAQKDNNDYPQFVIPLSRFEKAGLANDENFLATYDYGLIKLHPVDLHLFDF